MWLFARKREQSAPHHHQHIRRSSTSSASSTSQSATAGPAGNYGGVADAPWWARGQGAAIEALQTEEESRRKAGDEAAAAAAAAMMRRTSSENRFRSGSVGGLGWAGVGDTGGWGGSGGGRREKKVPISPVPEASLKGEPGTHFGRTSALRLRSLRRWGACFAMSCVCYDSIFAL